MTKRITVSQYNSLFAIAEVGIQQSWEKLGLSDDEICLRAALNQPPAAGTLPPVYYLQKAHANQIVNQILADLNIEVEDNKKA